MVIDAALNHDSKYLEGSYKKDPHTSSTVFFTTKFTKASNAEGVVHIYVKAPTKNIELGGTIKKENTYGCQGYTMNTTIEALDGKRYMVEVVTCSPFFIKVVTGLKGETVRYVTKVGLRSFSHAEISIMKNSEVETSRWWNELTGAAKERKETPAVGFSAKLLTPKTLALRTQFDEKTYTQFMVRHFSKIIFTLIVLFIFFR